MAQVNWPLSRYVNRVVWLWHLSSRTWSYLQSKSVFSSRYQTQVFLAVGKFMNLKEGQPFKIANLLFIVASHSSCVFLSIQVFKW